MNESQTIGFVTGATGYTGREVVRQLIVPMDSVVAHVRPDSKDVARWTHDFGELGAQIDTTAWTIEAFAETFGFLRPTHIFSLLGTTRSRGKKGSGSSVEDTYEAVDYGLTVLQIEAARMAGITPTFVYLSSMGANDSKTNAYMRVRWRVEQALQQSALPSVIARPSLIVGPDRDEPRPWEMVGSKLLDMALKGAGMVGARKLDNRYRSTTNGELAAALVRLGLDPACANQIFESDALRASPPKR